MRRTVLSGDMSVACKMFSEVLSVLLRTLKFDLPKDREITWKMMGIAEPRVGFGP